MFEITKRPIVILSAPRTGSSILTAYIHKLCNDADIKAFFEPSTDRKNDHLNSFLKYFSSSKNFIVKTHLTSIHAYPTEISKFLTTSDTVFRIRIQRKELVKQIASYYIAILRSRYHFHTLKEIDYVDTLPIHNKLLEEFILDIARSNKILSESQIKFDLDLIYEELPIMDNLNFYVVPKPTNYQEILDAITVLLHKKSIK
jgi:hypothetical protein